MLNEIIKGYKHNKYRDESFNNQTDKKNAELIGESIYLYFQPLYTLREFIEHSSYTKKEKRTIAGKIEEEVKEALYDFFITPFHYFLQKNK